MEQQEQERAEDIPRRRITRATSIRTQTTLLTVLAITVTMTVATLLGFFALRHLAISDSEQLLYLLCEAGEKNLDYYFQSVEQAVEMVSAYVESDLEGLEPEQLPEHLERVREIFAAMAYKTNGVLTCYYRIDPAFSETAKGFWLVNLNGSVFQEHAVTDITLYDTEDTSSLVWFTVPKATGRPIWLPPYITDNLDMRVISYNVPIHQNGRFVGVVGIEIDYSTMAGQVDRISLYDSGCAFISDGAGRLIYHPRMDVTTMQTLPEVPAGFLDTKTYLRYSFEGVEKMAVRLALSNGMWLNVAVPLSEVNAGWHHWLLQIFIVSVLLLALFISITMRFAGHITKPLRDLTAVAEQVNAGHYDCQLDYSGEDEVGILTSAFRRLISHLKTYISDLNDLAYADALTSVNNKGAFDIYTENLQVRLRDKEHRPEFAVCIFDCNNLKLINDQEGHDKGDIYLKIACSLICSTFSHSPVFRIGGDEFVVILQNTDFGNWRELLRRFDEACAERRRKTEVRWEQVNVARGIAVYNPNIDDSVHDVVRRADKLMYENKWLQKHEALQEQRHAAAAQPPPASEP